MTTLSTSTAHAQNRVRTRPRVNAFGRTGWLTLILLGHVALSLWYSLVIPPWEAHDEWAHYRHAAYIAANLALPDPSQRLTTEFEFDEANQPPLYYMMAALPMLVVDTNDGYQPTINPYATRGTGEGGVNFVLHRPEDIAWPWRGTLLALHLGRLVSVLISTASLLLTYALVRLLAPTDDSVALTATAIQAFAPQYVFLSAVMTNDILLVAIETALLYLALRLIREGPTPKLAFLLGLTAALSLLTKYLALAVIPIAVLAFAWGAWRHRQQPGQKQHLGRSTLAFLLPVAAPSLLWIGRNLVYTGMALPRDPQAQTVLLSGLQSANGLSLDWLAIPPALYYGFQTYWASFGWGNIGAPHWVYIVWLALVIGGGVGTLWWIARDSARSLRPLIVVTLLFVLAVVTLPLLRELLHESSFLRGRYILSTLPIIAWVLAQGWRQLSGRAWVWVQKLLVLWPAALTVALVPLLLVPAYAHPASLADSAAAVGVPLHVRFGDVVELETADVWPADAATPGQGLAVTLTWRVLDRTTKPYTLGIHLIGAGGESYGNVTSYPGHGRAATSVWLPGAVFQETYWLNVKEGGPTPMHGHIAVSLFDIAEGNTTYLPVVDPEGKNLGDSVTFGELRIDGASADTPSTPVNDLARFGDTLALIDARLPAAPQRPGWSVPVLLRWQAINPSPTPIKVTVQLVDADGDWVAGSDGVPSAELPPHLWRSGDRLHTIRWLDLPPDLSPGRYTVLAALYQPDTLARLPAIAADGNELPADAWRIGEIIVE